MTPISTSHRSHLTAIALLASSLILTASSWVLSQSPPGAGAGMICPGWIC